jgi:hypothetical protein
MFRNEHSSPQKFGGQGSVYFDDRSGEFSPAGGWCWPLPSGRDSSDADAQEDRTRAPGARARRVTEYASLSRLD